MANDTTTEKLAGLVLSATEVQELTEWPDPMVEDYLNILRNLINIAQDVDIIDDREIEFDKKASQMLAVLQGEIAHNKGRFNQHERVAVNIEQTIATLDGEVAINRARNNKAVLTVKKIEQLIYAW